MWKSGKLTIVNDFKYPLWKSMYIIKIAYQINVNYFIMFHTKQGE